jgi:hypothetical protein
VKDEPSGFDISGYWGHHRFWNFHDNRLYCQVSPLTLHDPITAEAFGWVPALATGSVFAMIGVGLWLFVRADKPITFHST